MGQGDDLLFELLNIDTVLGQILQDHFETSFASSTESLCAINEFWTVLVQTVISQVHIRVLEVLVRWLFVVLCAEPSQPLLVQETYIRFNGCDQHVQSQIKFLLLQ